MRGKKLLVVFYLLQLISVQTPAFYFSLAAGISFHITLSSAEVVGYALNLYALVMLLLCIRLVREHRHSTPAIPPCEESANMSDSAP